MKKSSAAIIIVVLAALITIPNWLFIVDETEQAIVTQFGQYIRTIEDPGLHTKTPFLQNVHKFEKRIISTDAIPSEYLTLDKKRLIVDFIARWKIVEPLNFFTSVATLPGARARIEDIVASQMRSELASYDLDEIIAEERESIMDSVAESASRTVRTFGIDIVDVRIKRADLPEEVQQSVFARMVAEREREAKRYRSEGEEEMAKIKAETDKQRDIILATSESMAQRIMGEGDAGATAIYADAFGKDPEFYSFSRSLEAYGKTIDENTLLIISSDSDFFKYFFDQK